MLAAQPTRPCGYPDCMGVVRGIPLLGAVVLAAAIAAVASLVTSEAETFLTHPVGALALAGSAVGTAAVATRRFSLGDRIGGRWLIALAIAVVGYLVLGAFATLGVDAAVGLWSVWWAVPLAVVQLAALAPADAPRWWSTAYGTLTAVVVALGSAFARPTEPFEGLQPLAPEAWAASPILDVLAAVQFAAAIAVPVVLVVRRAGVLAAVAAISPLLVIVCLGLAIARDPGAVEPAIGSVGYLVALSTGCLAAAIALALVRPAANAAVARRLVAAVVAAYAAVLVALVATLAGSWLEPIGPLASGLAVSAITLAVAGAWWLIVSRLLGKPEAPPIADRLAILSARENEVLALLADGVRDADIASRLHLSERTVESHLGRIFAKLGLDTAEGRNRRVLAVRAWSEADYGKTRIPG